MADAHAVYLVAQGSSFPVGCYLAYALSQMSVRSVLVDGIGGLLFQQAAEQHRVMFWSRSPRRPIPRRLPVRSSASPSGAHTHHRPRR